MKERFPIKRVVIIGLVLIITVFSGIFWVRTYNSQSRKDTLSQGFRLEKDTRLMMDTYVTISAAGPEKVSSRAIELAFGRMQDVAAKFSMHNPKSPVYAFNNQGVPISDPEILEVVSIALEISKKSGGAFDITISPLTQLWGFYGDSPRLPHDRDIRECLNRIGYKNLVIRNGRLEKRTRDLRIDLGGIAKGYNVGEALRVLRANGVTSALIDAGGDVCALGRKGSMLWKIGLRNPREKEILGYVEIENMAVMGSGDYERFFMAKGKRYHHIFNPKTGYPVRGLSGINLFHPDPMLADAWCTALFVMGQEKGLEFVEKMPDTEAVMITSSGEVVCSSGLENKIKQVPKND